ncbi:MAG: class I SAM-dependent methyltransferase [Pseudomonadota bacterium]
MNDVVDHNRAAWDAQSNSGESEWCEPVSPAEIARARADDWELILTPVRGVPRSWFGGPVADQRILCLASGGGQQAPLLAAAGARVTSFDNSPAQLEKDDLVARREGLDIELQQGDMADLSRFADGSFDLIFHPVSNVFAEALEPVWRECYRVLAEPGRLLSGFMNPDFFLFDHDALERGAQMVVTYRLPFADNKDLPAAELAGRRERLEALEFSHSLDAQIGGQIAAGFNLAGFYEDRWSDAATPLNVYMPTSMATLALKQG